MQAGNPILTLPTAPQPTQSQTQGNLDVQTPAKSQAQSSGSVNVNVTAPDPDPKKTAALYEYSVSALERDHASAPIGAASSLLSGENIWTRTPQQPFVTGDVARFRNSARAAALFLFLLAIIWVGAQMAYGSAVGTTTMQQLLPPLIFGLAMAAYSETIILRSIDLCNWLNDRMGTPSLNDFSGSLLVLPDIQLDIHEQNAIEGFVSQIQGFVKGLFGSVLYAIVLIVLELKLIFREGVLWIASIVMPVSGALWAVNLTRGWGVMLFRLWFGWLFSQPLVVLCLALGGSLLTFLNLHDGTGDWLVRIAILFAAIKMVSFFAGGSLSGGAMFGMAGLMLLLRRLRLQVNRSAPSAASGGTATAPQSAPTVQHGYAGGTGDGTAATSRPWRPAYGAV